MTLQEASTKYYGELILITTEYASDGYRVGVVEAFSEFHPPAGVAPASTVVRATVNIDGELISVIIDALVLLRELIPLGKSLWAKLKRVWLLLFGTEQQMHAVKAYNRYLREE